MRPTARAVKRAALVDVGGHATPERSRPHQHLQRRSRLHRQFDRHHAPLNSVIARRTLQHSGINTCISVFISGTGL
jgi:hypothetical protein